MVPPHPRTQIAEPFDAPLLSSGDAALPGSQCEPQRSSKAVAAAKPARSASAASSVGCRTIVIERQNRGQHQHFRRSGGNGDLSNFQPPLYKGLLCHNCLREEGLKYDRRATRAVNTYNPSRAQAGAMVPPGTYSLGRHRLSYLGSSGGTTADGRIVLLTTCSYVYPHRVIFIKNVEAFTLTPAQGQ
jgi:hypothetical protein